MFPRADSRLKVMQAISCERILYLEMSWFEAGGESKLKCLWKPGPVRQLGYSEDETHSPSRVKQLHYARSCNSCEKTNYTAAADSAI